MKKRDSIDKYKIGDNIRKYRKQRRLTQDELSELLDVTSSYISQLERGDHFPSLATFLALCEVLDVEASVLLSDFIPSAYDETDHKRWKLIKFFESLDDDEIDAIMYLVKTLKNKQKNHSETV